MRINYDYIEVMLNRALDHPDAQFDLNLFNDLWNEESKEAEFFFHLEILDDLNVIENTIDSSGLGFRRCGDGQYIISIVPLRLTAHGHDFAAALTKAGVLETLKTTFKDAGPTEMIKATFGIAAKITEAQLKKAIGE
ncbi:DUF2513 domain-containing protein [Shewanella sp. KT0246]|uniref:DUF2513 domain-containing protein n=1 Tax=Shewanella sp. KT0246 TaxID=2815912 RepID=UPI001BC1584E|nr:DUF2513 domain-containing protein [Shewanella sp. KT0246]GIU50272.1 hypothetical protein TUM4249_10120 [Shewanella sp. KT0246]